MLPSFQTSLFYQTNSIHSTALSWNLFILYLLRATKTRIQLEASLPLNYLLLEVKVQFAAAARLFAVKPKYEMKNDNLIIEMEICATQRRRKVQNGLTTTLVAKTEQAA